MFYKYEIKNYDNEKILYLYLTMNYEFSNELRLNKNDDLTRRTKNFIENNNINFNGDKVYLVIDNIVVKSLSLNKKNEIELLSNNLYFSNDKYFVNIKTENNLFYEISLKELLLGSLSYIYFEDLSIEVLKAMAILFRTYIYKSMKENNYILENNYFFKYKPISYYKLYWIKNFNKIFDLINKAIYETDCIFAYYKNNYILPFYHYCNNGMTFYINKYKYLKSISSFFDLTASFYLNYNIFTYKEISKLLKNNININSIFNFQVTNEYITYININNKQYDVDYFVNKLNLKSNIFKIILNKNNIIFITKGWGNSLGLSLYGSNELSKNNLNCFQIINYYFKDISFKKYITEIKNKS